MDDKHCDRIQMSLRNSVRICLWWSYPFSKVNVYGIRLQGQRIILLRDPVETRQKTARRTKTIVNMYSILNYKSLLSEWQGNRQTQTIFSRLRSLQVFGKEQIGLIHVFFKKANIYTKMVKEADFPPCLSEYFTDFKESKCLCRYSSADVLVLYLNQNNNISYVICKLPQNKLFRAYSLQKKCQECPTPHVCGNTASCKIPSGKIGELIRPCKPLPTSTRKKQEDFVYKNIQSLAHRMQARRAMQLATKLEI